MRPLFLAADAEVPPATLVVDAAGAGAAAVYSHWRDAPPTPPELAADTSTGMLLRAATDPPRWLNGFDQVANDHVDADGLLAVAIACRPGLARPHAALLEAAAEAGDFSSWPGEPAFRLMLRLHQLIRDERSAGIGWEQRCYASAADHLERILADSALPDEERDAQVAQVLDARARLQSRRGFTIHVHDDLACIAWERVHGHAVDAFTTVHQVDDLPPWALGGMFPDTTFQLLIERRPAGAVYRLDAPRHSWARTVSRLTVPWPDLGQAQERLQSGEGVAGCRWLVAPDSRTAGFTCLLASVGADGLPGPSSLVPTVVANVIHGGLLPRNPRPRR